MNFILLVTCLGTITNQHVTVTKDSYWVEFKIGTPMACQPDIKIKDKRTNDLLAYWTGIGLGTEYRPNSNMTLTIPQIK